MSGCDRSREYQLWVQGNQMSGIGRLGGGWASQIGSRGRGERTGQLLVQDEHRLTHYFEFQ